MRDRVELVPQRLRVDHQAVARHHPHLAFERQMIGVLRHRDADAGFGRIPTTGDHLRRAGRRDHRAVAGAAVLLAPMMLDLVRQLDGRDPLRVFRLAGHFGQRAPARGTGPLIRRQLVADLHDGQGGLRAWPMARPWRTRQLWYWRVRRPCEQLRAPLLERPQLGERELLGIGESAHTRELRGQLQLFGDEALILALEEETDLPQGLDIAFLR
jgi:hypothetical protein